MADRIPLPVPGAIDLDAWGIPLTQAVNEHDQLIGRVVNGTQTVSFSGLSSTTVTVSFGLTFPAPPFVAAFIASGSGATAQWHARPINITAVDFGLFLFAPSSGTWSSIPVNWMALYQP